MSDEQVELQRALSLLDRAERRITALEERLERVETENSHQIGPPDPQRIASAPIVSMDEVSSRRGLFKVAGAVASAAVAHNLLAAGSAAASTSGPFVGLNVVENTTAATGVTMTPGSGSSAAFQGTNLATTGSVDGIKGVSDSAQGAGVAGSSNNGYGVYGTTSAGYAVYSNGRFGLGQHVSSPGAPVTGDYLVGDIVRDSVGNVFACVGAGSAVLGTAIFRKLTGPATAGQLHLLDPVRRAYDTRSSQVGIPTGAAQGGQGSFTSGVTRTVDLSVSFPGTSTPLVPAGATAALLTVAVFGIAAEGFATLFPFGSSVGPVIHSFWGNIPGSQTSSMSVVRLDAARRFSIRTSLGVGTVEIALDVLGYYL